MNKAMQKIIIAVILTVVGVLFALTIVIPQTEIIFAEAEEKVSANEEHETLSDQNFLDTYLDISNSDSPEIAIYQLFKNLNPDFLNKETSSKIVYNSFILDLGSKSYNILNSDIIEGIKKGLEDFDDSNYVISASCNVIERTSLSYEEDCWSSSIDIKPNTCLIYVSGNSGNRFDDRLKIKVAWYIESRSGKDLAKPIIALCDG